MLNPVDIFSGKYTFARWWILFGALLLTGCTSSNVSTVTPEETSIYGLQAGRPHWKLHTPDGLTFILERLYPDMVRTFYLSRGFKLDAANRYTTTCVYKSVLRNDATEGVMEVHLRDWQIVVGGKTLPYKIEPDWQKEWSKMSVSRSARIAFKWSQFRPVQTFNPGDWLQGMSNVDLKPNTRFDINLVWKRNGKTYHGVLKNVECGPPEK